MSSTLPPRSTGDTPDGGSQGPPPAPLLPDETALRRVFDAEFHPLLESASRELGAAATLAPKVVEAAFVHAWEQRDRFQTRTGLDAFLRDEVHHGAARTLSRRAAAHRLGHHEELHAGAPAGTSAGHSPAAAVATPVPSVTPAADVETSWKHVVDTLHDQGPSHDAVRAHAVEVSRHDAARHVASVGKEGAWWPLAVAGVLALLAIFAGIRWADRAGEDTAVTRALNAQDTRAASSGHGQMANVTLGEGSRVRLAPDTRVVIPNKFGEKLRAVRVEGAATVDVKPGLLKPLQVHAGNAVITATGTSFSVRAWPGEQVTVLVHEGSVTVRVGTVEHPLAAGEAVVVGADGAMQAPDAQARRTSMAWTDGRVVVPEAPLDEVVAQLRRWYNLDVGLADPALKSRRASVDAPITSAKEAIASIEAQAKVKYGYAGRNLVFKDASAAPATSPPTTKPGARR